MLISSFILLAMGAHFYCTAAILPGTNLDSMANKDGYKADEERLRELEDEMNTILMSLYTGEHQPSNNPDVTLTADHRNKNNDNMLAKRINFLGSRGKRLQFLGSRGKRFPFLGSRGKRLQFLGSRG